MARYEKSQFPTFRLGATWVATTGVTIEIANPTGSGRNLRLRKFNVFATANIAFTIRRRSAVATGGTSADITATICPAKFGAPASVATAKSFTVAPTAGTNLDAPIAIQIPTQGGLRDDISDDTMEPLVLSPGEVLSIDANGGATVIMNLAWTEENF